MKTSIINLLAILTVITGSSLGREYHPDISTSSSPQGTNVFQPNAESIAQHYHFPDWYRDGKFGIFIHWGPASVPAHTAGWYARQMYDTNDPAYAYHVKTYGPVTTFGFKDFIPMFRAEKFNADEWMKLFREAGATYVVPVAEHHDGFALYNSTFNPWNAVKMGPKRDLIAELQSAAKKAGLHFGLSSHRAENCWFFNLGKKIPSDVRDGNYSLYGECIDEPDGESFSPEIVEHEGSNEHSRHNWLLHVYELVDQYHPELIFFDWTVGKKPFQPAFYQFMAYYYNCALDWKQDVVVNTKFGYPDNIQVTDIERGKSNTLRPYPWQTDTSVGKDFWFYMKDKDNDVKTPDHLIDDLVDIVSKNGNLLLNVGPRADGTISESQQAALKAIGQWLRINGEAIYGTRPWIVMGEGPTKGTSGMYSDGQSSNFTSQDIRFTRKGSHLYAIVLDRPDSVAVVKTLALGSPSAPQIKEVRMLGYDGVLNWKQTANGLEVQFPAPDQIKTQYAYVLKIN